MPMPIHDDHYIPTRSVLAAAIEARSPTPLPAAIIAPVSADSAGWLLTAGMVVSGVIGWMIAMTLLR